MIGIVMILFGITFSNVYAPCIEGPGIDCNNYPPHSLSQIKSDKMSYETSDKPVITIIGNPYTVAHLEIDDSSSKIIFTQDINLSSNGTTRYVLDVSSYKSGVYYVIATSLISKLTTSFAVGLSTTGGSIMLLPDKNSYFSGDNVTISGWWNPNTMMQLLLTDPNGISVKSLQIFSDKTGHFSSLDFSIPSIATPGTWKIYGTAGVNQVSVDISVKNIPGTQTDKAIVISPLEQFKSGIKPEYVKCSSNLHLIIKAEDGSFACVTIETAKILVLRGWAATFSTGISTSDYYTKCDTLYPQSDTGVAVLYMPTNIIGKICVQYHNVNNTPTTVGMRIFEANNMTRNATDVTAWTYDSTLEANANKTIVYFVKTGNKTGFYGASLNCGGIPLAVGYNDNSAITANDFPWIGQAFHCGAITYDSHIEGTTGIGVKYIPYP